VAHHDTLNGGGDQDKTCIKKNIYINKKINSYLEWQRRGSK
jgi:hypothetical protein